MPDISTFIDIKKDKPNGVAALDASGNILAPGETLSLTRDDTDFIYIRERTSGENCIRIDRVATNDYSIEIAVEGAGYRELADHVWSVAVMAGKIADHNNDPNANSAVISSHNGAPAAHWWTVPATATSTGTPGRKAYDADYLYVCVSNNTWKRVALETWA